MKSVYDSNTRNEIIARINALSQANTAQWGRMDLFQMLKHCTLCDDMFLGKLTIKRVFIGRLIGPTILKKSLKEGKPFGKNAPTSPLLKTTTASGDMEQQKQEWINRLMEYSNYSSNNYVHPFFGPMTNEQVGIFAYKHADHHLRQFGDKNER